MSVLVKVLAGAAGLAAAVGFASPAAAQYYPNYGNNGGGVVGAIVNSVLGGGQQYGYAQPYGYGQQYGAYGYNQGNSQYATSQCSRAVQARLGGGYNNYGGRVLGVTSVERRNNGLRVRGVASSGRYGYTNGTADLSFNCRVNSRGRVTDVDLDRRNVSYGYNNGYNNGYYRGY